MPDNKRTKASTILKPKPRISTTHESPPKEKKKKQTNWEHNAQEDGSREESGRKEALRNDEIELLRAREVADAGVGHVGGLVRRHHVVPHAHLLLRGDSALPLSIEGNCKMRRRRKKKKKERENVCTAQPKRRLRKRFPCDLSEALDVL